MPQHVHPECSGCRLICTQERFDVYRCDKGSHISWLARYGSEPDEYQAWPEYILHSLTGGHLVHDVEVRHTVPIWTMPALVAILAGFVHHATDTVKDY